MHNDSISFLEKDLLQVSLYKEKLILNKISCFYDSDFLYFIKDGYYQCYKKYFESIYSKYSFFEPMERFEILKSISIVSELSKLIAFKFPKVSSIWEYRFYNERLRPYLKTNFPTYSYIKKMSILDFLNSLYLWGGSMKRYEKNCLEYSLEERIFYGLPLSEEEILYFVNMQKEHYLSLKKFYFIFE